MSGPYRGAGTTGGMDYIPGQEPQAGPSPSEIAQALAIIAALVHASLADRSTFNTFAERLAALENKP